MDTNRYNIIIVPTAIKEINKIYEYIADDLYAEKATTILMNKIEKAINELTYAPKIHMEIEKINELRKKYRRIVIQNYMILYTIDDYSRTVYVSHVYYKRRNYLDLY